jgi:hypothetical protein
MQKKLTWALMSAALLLFAFIYYVDRRIPSTAERAEAPLLFPELNPMTVSSIRFNLGAAGETHARRTDAGWILAGLDYPAQQASVENFLTNVALLRKLDRLAPHEVALQGAAHFGLEPPRATVEIEAGTNKVQFQIGGRAPLTNNIYLRLQPSGDVILASSAFAGLVPASTNAWRDPRLIAGRSAAFDGLRIRVGPRAFEIGRSATNRNGLWRIERPVPARADQQRIAALVELLRSARVQQFVADRPADLDRFGLQSPDLELSFLSASNKVYSVEFGTAATNAPGLVHARLLGRSNVVTVAREVADALRQPYKNFHDPQLVNIHPEALDRIMIEFGEKFSIERAAGGGWTAVRGADRVSVDGALLSRFLTNVLSLEIADIAKEVPTEADLRSFGLLSPTASFAFFEKFTNSSGQLTNILFSEISFGTNFADRVYARRSDEAPVYFAPLGQLFALPRRVFEFRERQLWEIPETNIVRVAWSNAAGQAILQRGAGGSWSDDPIANEAMQEAVHRLASLEAAEWTTMGEARKASFGIRAQPLTMTIEAKTAAGPLAKTIEFGNATIKRNVYAATVLPGDSEPVIFEFPGVLFHSFVQLLPVPQ